MESIIMDKKELNKNRSAAIIAFFAKRTNIKRDPICQKVGYDSSNLLKVIKKPDTRTIPSKHLADFERYLKLYGFEPFRPE